MIEEAFMLSDSQSAGYGGRVIPRETKDRGYKKGMNAVVSYIHFRGLSKPLQKIMITTDTHANRLYITHS